MTTPTTDREKRMLTVARMLVATADSAIEYEDGTEGEIISANWDVLGPLFRKAVDRYSDCPNYPLRTF